jgi:hypothetical protein
MVFVDDVLEEEKLLLQPRILSFEFMHIERAKLQYINLFADSVQDRVTHEKRTRVDT